MKPDTCEPYNIRVYITRLLVLGIIYQALATSVWFKIDIYVYWNEMKLLKSVTCRSRLPTHSAWLLHIYCMSPRCLISGYHVLDLNKRNWNIYKIQPAAAWSQQSSSIIKKQHWQGAVISWSLSFFYNKSTQIKFIKDDNKWHFNSRIK